MESNNRRSFSFSARRVIYNLFLVFSMGVSLLISRGVSAESYVVTSTRGDSEGTFPWAIEQSNNNEGIDVISFDLLESDPGYNFEELVWDVHIFKPLPVIKESVTITGPPFSETPRVVIRGDNSSLDEKYSGIEIEGGSVVVENIHLRGFSTAGIKIGSEKSDAQSSIKIYRSFITHNGFSDDTSLCGAEGYGNGGILGLRSNIEIYDSKLEHNNCVGVQAQGASKESSNYVKILRSKVSSNVGVGVEVRDIKSLVLRGDDETPLEISSHPNYEVKIDGTQEVILEYVNIQNSKHVTAFLAKHVDVLYFSHVIFHEIFGDAVTLDSIKSANFNNLNFLRVKGDGVSSHNTILALDATSFNEVEGKSLYLDAYRDANYLPTSLLVNDTKISKSGSFHLRGGCILRDSKIIERATPIKTSWPFYVALYTSAGTPLSAGLEDPIYVRSSGQDLQELYLLDEDIPHIFGAKNSPVWSDATGFLPQVSYEVLTTTPRGTFRAVKKSGVPLFCDNDWFQDRLKDDAGTLDDSITLRMDLAKYDQGMQSILNLSDIVGGPESESSDNPGSTISEINSRSFNWLYTLLVGLAGATMLGLMGFLLFARNIRKMRQGILASAVEEEGGMEGDVKSSNLNSKNENTSVYQKTTSLVRFVLGNKAFVFAIMQIVISILNYLFFMLLARAFIPEVFGVANTLLAALFILSLPTVILQDFIMAQCALLKSGDEYIATAATYFKIICVVVSIITAALFLAIKPLSVFIGLPSPILLLGLMIVNALNYLLPVARGVWQAHEEFVKLGYVLMLEVLIKIGAFFLIFKLTERPFISLLGGITVGYVWSVIALYTPLFLNKFLKHLKSPLFSDSNIKMLKRSFLSQGIYFLGFMMILSLMFNLDILLVNHFFPKDTGVYGVAARVSQLIVFWGISISTVALSKFQKQKYEAKIEYPLLLILLGVVGFYAIMIPFGDFFIQYLFGDAYQSALPVILRLGVGSSSLAVSMLFGYWLISQEIVGFIKYIAGVICLLLGLIIFYQVSISLFIGLFIFADLLILGIVIFSYIKSQKYYLNKLEEQEAPIGAQAS